MASKALRSTVATLSLCLGCAILTEGYFLSLGEGELVSTDRPIIDRAKRTANAAINAWPGQLTNAEVRELCDAMSIAELACFPGDNPKEDAISYTSLCLGLLDELLQKITNPARRKLVEELNAAMTDLHNYLDETLDCTMNYERASSAVEIWKQKLGLDA